MATINHMNNLLQGLKEDGMSLKGISDGYHTFEELYEHRIILFIALCNIAQSESHQWKDGSMFVWRSKLHSDGTMFDDSFIMGIRKKPGCQMTYHLPLDRWALTDFAETLDRAPEWDGHSSNDVLLRIAQHFIL